jgi:pyruvate-formate lyase-activating enzyme
MFSTMRNSTLVHRFRLLRSYMRKSSVCPGLPLTGIIATTYRCNMTCRMCLRKIRNFSGPDMEFSLFKKIVDGWLPYLRYLSLDGLGETIACPDAFQMIRYAKSKKIRVMLSTNGTLVDAPMADAIIDSGVDLIAFSINGASPEVYKAVHGCNRYQEVKDKVHQFLACKLKRRASILVSLQMIRLPETLHQVGDFYRQWRRVPGVDFVRVKQDVMRGYGVLQGEAHRCTTRRTPCSRLWHGPPYVDTNGDVYASPGGLLQPGPVGNLQHESLAAVWNCERMQAIRRAHISKDISSFRECVQCAYPRPILPLVLAGFLLDPYITGKLIPLSEKLAFINRLPLYEKIPE